MLFHTTRLISWCLELPTRKESPIKIHIILFTGRDRCISSNTKPTPEAHPENLNLCLIAQLLEPGYQPFQSPLHKKFPVVVNRHVPVKFTGGYNITNVPQPSTVRLMSHVRLKCSVCIALDSKNRPTLNMPFFTKDHSYEASQISKLR